MIRYKCDKCGSVLKIKDRLAGTKGKCPKCETAFKVPAAPASDTSEPDDASDDQDVSEEDAIFGKDFFTQQETPKGPQQPVPVSSSADDDSDPGDFAGDDVPSVAANPQPFSAAKPSSTDNSANIAGQLLSKTGKKNRPDDWQDPNEEEGGYDFSAIRYVVLYRIAPIVLGGILLAWGGFALFSDMVGDKLERPPLAEVSGVVTLDGKVVQAMVIFQPDAGGEKSTKSGSMSQGRCDENGKYTLSYTAEIQGAVIGKHNVIISVGHLRFQQKAEVKEGENPATNFEVFTPATAPPQPN